MKWIKQSTAVVVPFGPFVSPSDGVTLVTNLVSALDHVSTGVKLAKNGGTLAVRNLGAAGSPTGVTTPTTYDAFGIYKLALDATDTATLGSLRAIYADSSTCLPVWEDFMVVPANVYDAIISGSDNIKVDAVELDSDTDAAARARRLALGVALVTVGTGSSPTSIILSGMVPAAVSADHFKGKILTFDKNTTTVALRGQSTDITASSAAGSPDVCILTVTSLTNAPVSGDTATIS